MTQTRYALIGAAGYIAPRHLKAIKATGGTLAAAYDPSDSVGIMDSHFPQAQFFTEFERFDRHIDMLSRKGDKIDYMAICSPNYLHDAHARFAMRSHADAICEKPLVLNPHNIDGLEEIERETGKRVYTILQLRLHPVIVALRAEVAAAPADMMFDVNLTYITPRGAWYGASWKGDEAKSGGIATNIGVHFFDMLGHVFGKVKESKVHLREPGKAAGYLEFSRARVRWFLSINAQDLPAAHAAAFKPFRSITIDGRELEFSEGFTDLHTDSYSDILNGGGFSLSDVRPCIETVSQIRVMTLSPIDGSEHSAVHTSVGGAQNQD